MSLRMTKHKRQDSSSDRGNDGTRCGHGTVFNARAPCCGQGLPRSIDSDIFAAQRQYAERRRALARLLGEVEGAAVSTDRPHWERFSFILLQRLVPSHHWHFHILVETVLTTGEISAIHFFPQLGFD